MYLKGHSEATLAVTIDTTVVPTQQPASHYGPWTQYTIDNKGYTGTHAVSFATNADGEGQEIFRDDVSAEEHYSSDGVPGDGTPGP